MLTKRRHKYFRQIAPAALFTAVALASAPAYAEIITNDAPVGRFANDLHHEEGIVADSGCGPAPSPAYDANYRPGIDAYGNPVIPAESGKRWRLGEIGVEVPVGDNQAFVTLSPEGDGQEPSAADCVSAPK